MDDALIHRRSLGWRSRSYLPHFDQAGLPQFVTFGLADALPRHVLEGLERELGLIPEEQRRSQRRRKTEAYLDSGSGACQLREPRVAAMVEEALMHFDGSRYRLLAWCIMPNHLHALVEVMAGHHLDELLHSWKSFTAKSANRLLGRKGEFWKREYHDRFIRDGRHFARAVRYIEDNPVKAGLVGRKDEWRWNTSWSGRI